MENGSKCYCDVIEGDRLSRATGTSLYPASRGFSLVFLSVVLPFSSRFRLLAFCFGCFCAEEKTSADSRLQFLLSMRCRYLQDLGGNHMTKPIVEPISTQSSSAHVKERDQERRRQRKHWGRDWLWNLFYQLAHLLCTSLLCKK